MYTPFLQVIVRPRAVDIVRPRAVDIVRPLHPTISPARSSERSNPTRGVPFVEYGMEPLPQELQHAAIVAVRFGDVYGVAVVRTALRRCWSLHSCRTSAACVG